MKNERREVIFRMEVHFGPIVHEEGLLVIDILVTHSNLHTDMFLNKFSVNFTGLGKWDTDCGLASCLLHSQFQARGPTHKQFRFILHVEAHSCYNNQRRLRK